MELNSSENFTVIYVQPRSRDKHGVSRGFDDAFLKGVGDMMVRRIEDLAHAEKAACTIVERLDWMSCIVINCDQTFADKISKMKGIVEVKPPSTIGFPEDLDPDEPEVNVFEAVHRARARRKQLRLK